MPTIIAFHTLHDANVCICRDGEVLVALELERLFNVRYFVSNPRRQAFTSQWKKAIETVTQFTKIKTFDIAVTSWVMPTQIEVLKTLVHAERWVTVKHHVAHAHIGFYDSPFNRALILSLDGGGNDGTFNVHLGDRVTGIKHIEWVPLNMGSPYRNLACAMKEVTREKFDPDSVTAYMRTAPLALSGKVMGYAALGKVRKEWLPAIFHFYEKYVTPLESLQNLGEELGLVFEPNALSDEDARDVAATSQYVFAQIVGRKLAHFREVIEGEIDGVVLTGGCALNVHTNQYLLEKFGYAVHVCPAPNDCGISVGAAWAIEPPKVPQQLQYIGLPCWDMNILQNLIKNRHPEKVTVPQLAQLLLDGAVIGVVRGRQEFGPRALGHRSMLCYPNKSELKDKLNKLKGREWFRPLCPSVAVESVPQLFLGRKTSALQQKLDKIENRPPHPDCCVPSSSGDPEDWVPLSPYMSFAPFMTDEGREKFPTICHFDGTARLQTVSASDEPWYHELLTEIGRQNGGFGILLNTSFNVKGKPILNHLSKAFNIMDTSPEGSFDYVLIEDWLFKPQRNSPISCEEPTPEGSHENVFMFSEDHV